MSPMGRQPGDNPYAEWWHICHTLTDLVGAVEYLAQEFPAGQLPDTIQATVTDLQGRIEAIADLMMVRRLDRARERLGVVSKGKQGEAARVYAQHYRDHLRGPRVEKIARRVNGYLKSLG